MYTYIQILLSTHTRVYVLPYRTTPMHVRMDVYIYIYYRIQLGTDMYIYVNICILYRCIHTHYIGQ